MYAMKMDEPELPALMQRGLYPELVDRAMKVVRPVLSEAETGRFCNDDSPPIDMKSFCGAISGATGMVVNEVIVMPDDGKLPTVQRMAQSGQLSPQHRTSDLLQRLYGGSLKSLAPDIKEGLRRRLGRIFRLDDEKAAMSGGLEYAVRMARRDALYHFLALVIAGDEPRARKLAEFVQWARLVVPLAVVDVRRGLWLAHRVS